MFVIFKPILFPSTWSSFPSDLALWRHQHAYACLLRRLSALNENKIHEIREFDKASCVEILPAEHRESCWKITKWTQLVFSLLCNFTNQFLHTSINSFYVLFCLHLRIWEVILILEVVLRHPINEDPLWLYDYFILHSIQMRRRRVARWWSGC